MKRHFQLILIILTVVLLFLPMAQEHLGLFSFMPLYGVMDEDPRPKVNLSNIAKQKLQRWTEAHLRLNHGFREPLIRLYNQYRWDVFGQANQLEKKRLFMDDKGWLYESQFVEEHYQGRWRNYGKDSASVAYKFNEEVFRLYQLQHILEENGTHLFVLLIPGKELIYPEHIPQTSDYPGAKTISAYNFYQKKLKEQGINHIDASQWFLELKDSVDYPLFPQTGTHWSNYAAMHVTDSLIRYMEQLGDMKIAHFDIGERQEKTVYPDDDLEQLLNLIRPLPKQPNYYAETSIVPDSTAKKPVILTIGDSNFWNIMNATPFGKIMERTPFWYYFNIVYFDEPHRYINEVDVMEQVLDADFVMIAYNTVELYKMSQGFSQQLLLEMCCDEEDLAEAKQQLIIDIRNNRPWMELLNKTAEQWDLPLDSVVCGEAQNSIMKWPELFVPALKDSIPTHRSQRYLDYLENKTKHHGLQ